MSEKLYLVTKSKSYYHNTLAYNPKTSEYVYLHNNQEVWREKAGPELFDYMNNIRANNTYADFEELQRFNIYVKYCNSCQ